MNGFVCLLMFVFCVCLTAVALSGLFANMLVHERRQALQGSPGIRKCRERGKPDLEKPRHMGPLLKANEIMAFKISEYINMCEIYFRDLKKKKNVFNNSSGDIC